MKKSFLILLLIILNLFVAACYSIDSYEKLYDDAYNKTKEAYFKKHNISKTREENYSFIFIGKYNDSYASLSLMKDVYEREPSRYFVEGYDFGFIIVDILKNNELYELKEAYELNYISIDDVKSIHEIYDKSTFVKLKYTYYIRYLKDFNDLHFTDVNVSNYQVLGKYDNESIILARLYCDELENKKIDMYFEYYNKSFNIQNQYDMIYVIYDNEIFELDEAFKKFKFLEDKVLEIYDFYESV